MRNLTKIIAAAAIAIATGLSSASAQTDTASLQINLEDLRATHGTVYLAVYANEADYENGPAVSAIDLDVSDVEATVNLDGLAPGAYGIKMYHDVNGNGEMDTNPFGMPTEPFAFSNNANGRFGPAKWDAAAFDITSGANTHTISFAQ